MLINIYLKSRKTKWLLDDLQDFLYKAQNLLEGIQIQKSEYPIRHADLYICLRPDDLRLCPSPEKTVVFLPDFFGNEQNRLSLFPKTLLVIGAHLDLEIHLENQKIPVPYFRVCPPTVHPVLWGKTRKGLSSIFCINVFGRPFFVNKMDIKGVRKIDRIINQLDKEISNNFIIQFMHSGWKKYFNATKQALFFSREKDGLENCLSKHLLADVNLIASVTETGPMSFFEASNCGVPTISTPVGWPSLLIENGQTGFIYHSPDSAVKHILEIYNNRKEWYERKTLISNSIKGFGNLEDWAILVLRYAIEAYYNKFAV